MTNQRCLLPRLKRKNSQITRSRQTVFAGLSSSRVPQSSEIVRMDGISVNAYPAIGTMEKRFSYALPKGLSAPHGIHLHESLIVALGEGLYSFQKDGAHTQVASVSNTDKTFASFGSLLFVFPDRICIDTSTGVTRQLSVSTGYLENVALGTNYLTAQGVSWSDYDFAVGDAIEIKVKNYLLGSTTSFFTKITAISGPVMFTDKTFERNETFEISVSRDFPEMTHICAFGDRLMGCHQNKIYVSEASNPFNWNVATDADSDPVSFELGGSGEVTACSPWQGNAVCFREDQVICLMGRGARDFVLKTVTAPGVLKDSKASLCEVDGALYYLSSGGVYCFDGDQPDCISKALPSGLTLGIGGTDGQNYYLAVRETNGTVRIYVYVTDRKCWYVQDLLNIKSMASWGDMLFLQTESGLLYRAPREGEYLPENQTNITEIASVLPSRVEFGEEHGNSPDGLRLHGIHLRAKGAVNSTLLVEIAYDRSENWISVGNVLGEVDGFIHLPVYPRRAEAYRLRLTMRGDWQITEICCDYERGKQ